MKLIHKTILVAVTLIFTSLTEGNHESDRGSFWPFPVPTQTTQGGIPVKDTRCGSQYPIDSTVSYKLQPLTSLFGTYFPSTTCVTDFLGTTGCLPVINCTEFNLAGSDFLEISDGMSGSQRFNTTNGPRNVSTGASILRATFQSGVASIGRGYKCVVSCASNATNSTTNLVSNALNKPTTVQCNCGVPGGDAEGPTRIVGGQNAPIEFWKWQTAMELVGQQSPFCGGALINDRYVLTAAHCVVTTGLFLAPQLAQVVFNEYDTSNTSETTTIRRTISRITPHPFYNASSQDYDVAVLEFSPPLNLTSDQEPKLTPVCLPARGVYDLYTGEDGVVTGWGTLSEGGTQATILQQAVVPVISNEDCNKKYSNKITPRMICAAYPQGGIDSCQGDSGGPFMLGTNTTKYTEIGVVSFGEGCARADKPGVYARVTDLNDWIRQVSWRANWCEE